MTVYRRYSTGTKLRFITHTLSPKNIKLIPRSTRQTWKQLTVCSFWIPPGQDELWDDEHMALMQALAENKKIKSLIRLLMYLLSIYKTVLKQYNIQGHHALAVYQILQQAMHYCSDAMQRFLFWKAMPFSYRQWKA